MLILKLWNLFYLLPLTYIFKPTRRSSHIFACFSSFSPTLTWAGTLVSLKNLLGSMKWLRRSGNPVSLPFLSRLKLITSGWTSCPTVDSLWHFCSLSNCLLEVERSQLQWNYLCKFEHCFQTKGKDWFTVWALTIAFHFSDLRVVLLFWHNYSPISYFST